MDFDKSATIKASPERIWAMMFDLDLVRSCVSGMELVELTGPLEYLAVVQVKLSFISARFKVRVAITETKEPLYLRSEGKGEDLSLTSSLKLTNEMFLADLGDGNTELRMKLKVDLFGRLGTFGFSIIKTKADRMWESSWPSSRRGSRRCPIEFDVAWP